MFLISRKEVSILQLSSAEEKYEQVSICLKRTSSIAILNRSLNGLTRTNLQSRTRKERTKSSPAVNFLESQAVDHLHKLQEKQREQYCFNGMKMG